MCTYLKFAFSAILIFCLSSVYSQDRLVTAEGTTIRGKITGVGTSSIKLKTEDGKTKKFSPLQVASFYDDGNRYLSRQVMDKKDAVWRFVRVVDAGTVNLMTIDEGYSPGLQVGTAVASMGMGGIGVSVGGGRKKPAYYIQKKDSTNVLEDILPGFLAGESRKQKVVEILQQAMGDIPEIAERINLDMKFTSKMLETLVKDYNDLADRKLYYIKESK